MQQLELFPAAAYQRRNPICPRCGKYEGHCWRVQIVDGRLSATTLCGSAVIAIR